MTVERLFKVGDVTHEYYTGHDRPLTAKEADELNRRFKEAKEAADSVYARRERDMTPEAGKLAHIAIAVLEQENARLRKALGDIRDLELPMVGDTPAIDWLSWCSTATQMIGFARAALGDDNG